MADTSSDSSGSSGSNGDSSCTTATAHTVHDYLQWLHVDENPACVCMWCSIKIPVRELSMHVCR